MKTLKYVSAILLATIVTAVQAKETAVGNVAGSLAPSGYLNASGANGFLPDYLSAAVPISSVVVAPNSIPTSGNAGQDFSAIAANTAGSSNPVGAQPLVVPEPATLALVGFGGLTALIFMRRFGKTNRA